MASLSERARRFMEQCFGSPVVALEVSDAIDAPQGSHKVLLAGTVTSNSNVSVTVSDSSITASDVGIAVLHTVGATPRTVKTVACSSGTLTITMSDDPSTDHVLSYCVLRALS